MTTIGFIGLGRMGGPMALNLIKGGFNVTVHDRERRYAAEHLKLGARWADTPRECAHTADTLITMLPTPTDIEQVLIADGAADALDPADVWIDMSTSTPEMAERVGEQLRPRAINWLDAPVSGMVRGATAGTLSIFVGGSAEVLASQHSVLQAMGRPEAIFHMGPHGAGYVTKLAGNALWFAHVVATAEVLALGRKAGVDFWPLRQSIIDSPHSSTFVETDLLSIVKGNYADSFAMSLACKDARLAVDIGRASHIPMELLGVVEQIYHRALHSYGPDRGAMTPIRLYEDMIGEPFAPATSRLSDGCCDPQPPTDGQSWM
jgi:3-hydroxyisobutyrate dehydrogenase